MKIAVAADHGGFHLKEHLRGLLADMGHHVLDVGATSPEAVDYPPLAREAAQLVGSGDADLGVVCCGSGVGVTIVANKVHGVRAVNGHDPAEAELARRHNDANVLGLGGRHLGPHEAEAIVVAFVLGEFEGGRHARRVGQIEGQQTPA
jgi:ribose 5-phosphate isomerase B